MKYIMIMLGLILLVFCTNCKDDEVPPPPLDPVESDINAIDSFIWEQAIDPPNVQDLNRLHWVEYPVLHDGNVVWNIHTMRGFVSLDTRTGEIVWDNRGIVSTGHLSRYPIKYNDKMLFSKSSTYYQMDMNSGNLDINEKWANSRESTSRTLILFEDQIYNKVSENVSDQYEYWKHISVHDSEGPLSWEEFGYQSNDIYEPLIRSSGKPVFHRQGSGDVLMIYGSLLHSKNYSVTKNIITAYNLTQDTVQWILSDFQEYDSMSVQPIIDGDRVYFGFENSTMCINADDGEILWYQEDERVSAAIGLAAGIHVFEDKLVVFGLIDQVFALDKHTGEIAWTYTLLINDEDYKASGSQKHSVNFYKDRLYYISGWGQLVSLNPHDGSIRRFYLPDRPPYNEKFEVQFFEPSFMHQDMIISEEGIVYTSDGHRFLAFEVPDKNW